MACLLQLYSVLSIKYCGAKKVIAPKKSWEDVIGRVTAGNPPVVIVLRAESSAFDYLPQGDPLPGSVFPEENGKYQKKEDGKKL